MSIRICKICIRSSKGQYGSNCITYWSGLLEILEKHNKEPYVFFIEGQYGSTCIVPDSNFSKDASNRNETRAFDEYL